MQNYSIIIVLFGQILSISYLQADLMDLISEARCAARCFNLFTKSLLGQDRVFLQQRPDLTQPHCINQKGTCALCLDVCQWPRTQTTQCNVSCQDGLDIVSHIVIDEEAKKTCMDACQFVEEITSLSEQFSRGQMSRNCPRLNSWPPSCQQRCKTDSDCSAIGVYKCCSSSLCSNYAASNRNENHTLVCTPAVMTSSGVPPISDRPVVKQTQVGESKTRTSAKSTELNETQYQLELDWSNYYNRTEQTSDGWDQSQYPAVFLVQLRQFHDPTASVSFSESQKGGGSALSAESISAADRFFDHWRNLVWTTKLGAVLSDLRPGTWYQFRLLTISATGFGGWSEPSKPVRVLTRPVPPSSPRNLSEMRTRIFDNIVDVTVRWQPPRAGNLPLKKYQVTWRRYYGFTGDDKKSFTEYEASVPGDRTVYTIQNLQPATTYKIEVKAVSVFEATELSSHPVSLFINTLPIPTRSVSQAGSIQPMSVNESCRCDNGEQSPIQIGEVFYENQRLKALLKCKLTDASAHRFTQYTVEWTPRVCIETQSGHSRVSYTLQKQSISVSAKELLNFELDNLQFQCHYKVTVTEESLSETEPRKHMQWTACFCTQSCHLVPVRSGPDPENCTNIAAYSRLRPMRVTYEVLPVTKTWTQRNTDEHFINDRVQTRQLHSSTDAHPTQNTRNLVMTYDAVIKWQPISDGSTESKRNYRTLFSRQSEMADGVRGTRVTWGPRIYEPVKPEAYKHGLLPLLDPEKTQSKVLHPHTDNLLLKGLLLDTLYIVHVQMIGDRMDGPTTTVFLSFPAIVEHTNAATKRANGTKHCFWWPIPWMLLIASLARRPTLR